MECAAPLGAPARAPRGGAQGRHRRCSATWSGSPPASESADPEDVDRMLSAYSAMARAQIEAHGGVVEKFIGDAVVGVFGVPAAHEDDPERAVRAGLRIVEDAERAGGASAARRCGCGSGSTPARRWSVWGSRRARGSGCWRATRSTPPRGSSRSPRRWGSRSVSPPTRRPRRCSTTRSWNPPTLKGKAEPVRVFHAKAPRARFGTDLTRTHDTPVRRPGDRPGAAQGDLRQDRGVAARCSSSRWSGSRGSARAGSWRSSFAYVDARPELIDLAPGPVPALRGGDHVLGAGGDPEGPRRDPRVRPARGRRRRSSTRCCPRGTERAWFRQRLLPLLGIEATSTRRARGAVHRLATVPGADRRGAIRRCWCSRTCTGPTRRCSRSSSTWPTAPRACPLLVVGTARPELYERHPDYAAGLRNANPINLAPLVAGGDRPAGLGAARDDGDPRRAAAADPRPRRGQPAVRRGVRAAAAGPGPAGARRARAGSCGKGPRCRSPTRCRR